MVRPANRRQRHHESASHSHLCEGLTAAFQLVQQAGGEHDAHERQSIVDGLRGTLGQAEVQQPTLNGNIIHKVNIAHAGGIGNGGEPELGCFIRQKNKANRNRGEESNTQGCDTLPIAAHQQNQAEDQRSKLQATRNADQHTARHAGRRTHKIRQHERHNKRVNLHEVKSTSPRAAQHHQDGQSSDSSGAAKAILQGQRTTGSLGVVVDNRRKPPRGSGSSQHHNGFAHLKRQERKGQEDESRKRRIGEGELQHTNFNKCWRV